MTPNEGQTAKRFTIRSNFKYIAFLLVAIVCLAAIINIYFSTKEQKQQKENTIEQLQLGMISSKVEVISGKLKDLTNNSTQLVGSDMFRLFASEVDMLKSDLSRLFAYRGSYAIDDGNDEDPKKDTSIGVNALAAQMPMMEDLLKGFVSFSGYISGRIVNRDAQTYIGTDMGISALNESQIEYSKKMFNEKHSALFAPLRRAEPGLVLDIFLPIYPPAFYDNADSGNPVGVLILSRLVSGIFSEFTASSPSNENSKIKLLQAIGGRMFEIAPWLPEGLRPINIKIDLDQNGMMIPFGIRPSIDVKGVDSYSTGLKVPETDWFVIEEAPVEFVLKDVAKYKKEAIIKTSLVAATLICLIIGLWWWTQNAESKKTAGIFKKLATTIKEQRRLVGSINAVIPDFIAYKSSEGFYLYVNSAFATAVGRKPKEMIGLDDKAIFGFDTAKKLKRTDDLVLISGDKIITTEETIFLQSKRYVMQVSKVAMDITAANKDDCFDDDIEFASLDLDDVSSTPQKGIVAVFRDITEMVESQERSKLAMKQTIEAMVVSIELVDPYLAGHSQKLVALSTEVAKELNLSEADISTIGSAAILSQIGKMFIPKDILNKPDALTKEEMAIMETHVEHARKILSEISFELPVIDVICQMNEKMDGSGYPNRLTGDGISTLARILGVINSFCAMISPRVYRVAKTPAEAVSILEKMTAQYDQTIVAKLKDIMNSIRGERLLNLNK